MAQVEQAVFWPANFDAVAFDLDGVVTATVRIHAEAWARMFDKVLGERVGPEARFTTADYLKYVDGRPRHDAIRSFLSARGISLPEGTAFDAPGVHSIHGLANRKNELFLDHVRSKGVEVYLSTVTLIRRLRALRLKTAVVSASRNCREVLRAARLEHLFDVVVDGTDAEALALKGKPAPDTFLEAARRLEVLPSRTVVVEDAAAGVAAGRSGGFGLVVGIDRSGSAAGLKTAGADLVVPDLGQLELRLEDSVSTAIAKAKPDVHRLDPFLSKRGYETPIEAKAAAVDPWVFACDGFDDAAEGRRETLFALGNGYFVTRGAAAEARADDLHYPGTYLAGGYNRLTSVIEGRAIEHEDLVNLPNWLPLSFRIDDGEWFDLRHVEILAYRQELDLRRGLYRRSVCFRDRQGRRTRLREQRFVHMGDKHLAGQQVTITSENWTGRIAVRASLDGNVVNQGVPRYRQYCIRHLRIRQATVVDPCLMLLEAETTQSQLVISLAGRVDAKVLGAHGKPERSMIIEQAEVGYQTDAELQPGATIEVTKIVALHTSRDRAVADSENAAREAITRAGSFEQLLESHGFAWDHLWRRCDLTLLDVAGDDRHDAHLAVRLHVFHLLQTASPHSIGLDSGIPARGWHGEGYRGHIFWDELFIFPFLNLRLPMLARALLLYRYRRLPEARWAARAAGHRGAMFPWQSGSNGREETDVIYFNPRSGNWIRDETRLQRHIGAAVALNVWRYYKATGDIEFLYIYGAELMLEVARFWAGIAQWNEERERFDIRGVMGPDEFHDRYPDRDAPGLDNNAYTNVMASWCITHALKLFALLPDERCQELCEKLGLERNEIEHWEHVGGKLYLPFHANGILSQFEGYEALEEFDWAAYRRKYRNIMRLDLILDAEGDSPNRYKLSKQADVLMLFYLFSAEELAEIFSRLGYAFDPQSIPRTIDYYLRRTSHGSTLSGIVHAWVLARSCRQRSWLLFEEALKSDIDDIQGGTTREGIHLGAMAGAVDLLQRCFTGMELRGNALHFHPALPDELERLAFSFRYRNQSLQIDLTAEELTLTSNPSAAETVSVVVNDLPATLQPGARKTFRLRPTSPAPRRT